jgi:hypothetical protein
MYIFVHVLLFFCYLNLSVLISSFFIFSIQGIFFSINCQYFSFSVFYSLVFVILSFSKFTSNTSTS